MNQLEYSRSQTRLVINARYATRYYLKKACTSLMKSRSSFYILYLDHARENSPLTFAKHLCFIRINNEGKKTFFKIC